VVYTGHNDLGNAMFQDRYGDFIGSGSAAVLPWLERLQIFCQLRRMLSPIDGRRSSAPGGNRGGGDAGMTVARREVAIRFFAANLGRIVWRCQQVGIPLVVVVPASDLLREPSRAPCQQGEDCPRQLWEQGRQLINTDPVGAGAALRAARDIDSVAVRAPTAMEEAVRALAGQPGVTVVDAAASLPRESGVDAPKSSFFRDHIHFSAEGHRAMADLLAQPIQDAITR
jgi:hypothetical protein